MALPRSQVQRHEENNGAMIMKKMFLIALLSASSLAGGYASASAQTYGPARPCPYVCDQGGCAYKC
ncbi:MAG: hypothetical protein ABW200_16120 [Hyphomicrobiaceae bacterium]|jgi:hypothetical protein